MAKPLMTAVEAAQMMRDRGMHTSVNTIITCIEKGFYTWGIIISQGNPDSKRRRRCVRINRKQFMDWLEGNA